MFRALRSSKLYSKVATGLSANHEMLGTGSEADVDNNSDQETLVENNTTPQREETPTDDEANVDDGSHQAMLEEDNMTPQCGGKAPDDEYKKRISAFSRTARWLGTATKLDVNEYLTGYFASFMNKKDELDGAIALLEEGVAFLDHNKVAEDRIHYIVMNIWDHITSEDKRLWQCKYKTLDEAIEALDSPSLTVIRSAAERMAARKTSAIKKIVDSWGESYISQFDLEELSETHLERIAKVASASKNCQSCLDAVQMTALNRLLACKRGRGAIQKILPIDWHKINHNPQGIPFDTPELLENIEKLCKEFNDPSMAESMTADKINVRKFEIWPLKAGKQQDSGRPSPPPIQFPPTPPYTGSPSTPRTGAPQSNPTGEIETSEVEGSTRGTKRSSDLASDTNTSSPATNGNETPSKNNAHRGPKRPRLDGSPNSKSQTTTEGEGGGDAIGQDDLPDDGGADNVEGDWRNHYAHNPYKDTILNVVDDDRAQVIVQDLKEGAWEAWERNGNLILPDFFSWIWKGVEYDGARAEGVGDIVEEEFTMYMYHKHAQEEWPRAMIHSLTQQLICQDLGYYIACVALHPDHNPRLVSYPYHTKTGHDASTRRLDIEASRFPEEENKIRCMAIHGSVGMIDEGEDDCTEIMPGFHRRIWEWWSLTKDEYKGRKDGPPFIDVTLPKATNEKLDGSTEHYGAWEDMPQVQGDLYITLPTIPHRTKAPPNVTRRTIHPWFVSVDEDNLNLNLHNGDTKRWSDVVASQIAQTTQYGETTARGPKFPAAAQLRLSSAVSAALMCRVSWDDALVQLEANELLGDDRDIARDMVDRSRFEALRLIREAWVKVKKVEGLCYDDVGAFASPDPDMGQEGGSQDDDTEDPESSDDSDDSDYQQPSSKKNLLKPMPSQSKAPQHGTGNTNSFSSSQGGDTGDTQGGDTGDTQDSPQVERPKASKPKYTQTPSPVTSPKTATRKVEEKKRAKKKERMKSAKEKKDDDAYKP